MSLLIGSQAALAWGVPLGREAKDTDWVMTPYELKEYLDCVKKSKAKASYYPISGNKWVVKFSSGSIDEIEVAYPGSTGAELLRLEPHDTASLEALLALKLSHRYLKNSPHFLKTMRDIHALRAKGATITPRFEGWLKRREAETLDYGHPSLAQTKANFFDKSVKYKYDHDAIHRAVAYLDEPAYLKYKSDNKEVYCSKEKWDAAPWLVKISGVAEEAYVLALERSIIPHPGVLTPKQAFDKALEKVCTSITSGWFREWAWENYWVVRMFYDQTYVAKFRAALTAGEIPYAKTSSY